MPSMFLPNSVVNVMLYGVSMPSGPEGSIRNNSLLVLCPDTPVVSEPAFNIISDVNYKGPHTGSETSLQCNTFRLQQLKMFDTHMNR